MYQKPAILFAQGAHLLQRCRAQLIACIHQLSWPICSEQLLNSRDLRVKRKELPSVDVLALRTYPTPNSSSSIYSCQQLPEGGISRHPTPQWPFWSIICFMEYPNVHDSILWRDPNTEKFCSQLSSPHIAQRTCWVKHQQSCLVYKDASSWWWFHKLSESWKFAYAPLRCWEMWDVLPLPWNWAFQPSLLLQIQRSFLALATTPAHTQAFVSRHVSERQDACWCLFLVALLGKNKLHLPFLHSENPIQPRVLKPSFFSPGTMALSAPIQSNPHGVIVRLV